jgi:hypothetical protein
VAAPTRSHTAPSGAIPISQSGRLLVARIVPHKLACQLLSFADQPLGLLAQLVLFRVGADLLTAFAHCLSPRILSIIGTTPYGLGSDLQSAD